MGTKTERWCGNFEEPEKNRVTGGKCFKFKRKTMLYSHIIHMQLYRYTCRNLLNTITMSDTVLRKKYLSLYLKGMCVSGSWRPNRTAHIDLPSSCGQSSMSFSFSRVAQPEAWGPEEGQLSAGCCFLYSNISPTL